jgi:hypothetical protein
MHAWLRPTGPGQAGGGGGLAICSRLSELEGKRAQHSSLPLVWYRLTLREL